MFKKGKEKEKEKDKGAQKKKDSPSTQPSPTPNPKAKPAGPSISENEVKEKFEKLLSDRGITGEQRIAMLAFPLDTKLVLIEQHKNESSQAKEQGKEPAHFVQLLKADIPLKDLSELRISLGSAQVQWLENFIRLDGPKFLFDRLTTTLAKERKEDNDLLFITEIIRCLRALTKEKSGIEAVIANTDSIKTVMNSLDFISDATQAKTIELLAVLSHVSKPSHAVISSDTALKTKLPKYLVEENRELQLRSMTLINSILNGCEEVVQRNALREELNLEKLLPGLRKSVSKFPEEIRYNFGAQLDFYEDLLMDDSETATPLVQPSGNPIELFEKLLKDMKDTRVNERFLSVVQKLPLVHREGVKGSFSWQVIDSVVENVIRADKSFNIISFVGSVMELVVQQLGSTQGETEQTQYKDANDIISDPKLSNEQKFAKLKSRILELTAEIDELKKAPPPPAAPVAFAPIGGEGGEGGGPPPPPGGGPPGPPPPPGMGGPPGPPPPPGMGGPPGPPPPPGMGGPPGPPPPPGMGGPPGPPPPPGMGGPPGPPPPPGMGGPPGPPPPPGMGGPPPPPGMGGPPGPPGMGMPKKPKKPSPKPRQKMKQFNWTKVPDIKIDKTIWTALTDDHIKLDLDELDDLFSAFEKKAPAPGEGKSEKEKVVQLLDTKRSNNTSIMISRFKPPAGIDVNHYIKKAVVDFDIEVMTVENIQILQGYVPTPEEIALLNEYTGDVEKLGIPEKFFLEMMRIPRMDQKLEAYLTERTFEVRCSSCEKGITAIKDTCQAFLKSPKWKKLLEIILAIGNYMNGGGARGGAYGFTIESLLKLGDIRANSGDTMMNYIAQLSEGKFTETKDLEEDFPLLEQSTRESIPMIQADMATVKKGLNVIQKELSESAPGDNFTRKFESFFQQASARVAKIEENFDKMKASFKELLAQYGESEKPDSQETLGSLYAFVSGLDRAKKENVRKRIAAEKAALAEKKRAEAEKKRAEKKGPGAPAGPANPSDKGLVDDVFSQMMEGRAF